MNTRYYALHERPINLAPLELNHANLVQNRDHARQQ